MIVVLLCAVGLSYPQTPVPPSSQQQAFRISGIVVNSVTNEAVAGVEVTIASTTQRDEGRQVLTTSAGRFVFENLPHGKYSLAGHRQGFTAQAYQQHGPFSTAIAVGPGHASENLVFSLTPDASISGQVLDEENEPVRTGQVLLFEQDPDSDARVPQMHTSATLDDQGRYRLSHLSAGTYFLVVMAQPWYAQDPRLQGTGLRFGRTTITTDASPVSTNDADADSSQTEVTSQTATARDATGQDSQPSPLDVAYPTIYYPTAIEPEDAAPIVLHPGERATADFNLRAVPALHLRIRDSKADATHPGTVVVMQRLFNRSDNAPVPLPARTQQIGPGLLSLTGIPPGHLLFNIRTFNGKEWAEFTKEVDVNSDSDIDANDVNASAVAITGVIRTPSGKPLPVNTAVRFSNPESGDGFGASVNEKGLFETERTVLSHLNYDIELSVTGLLVQTVSATGAKVSGHTIELPRSGSVQLVITLAEGAGRVDGTVMRADKPQSQTMVVLVPEHLDDLFLYRRDQSDSDGTFSLYQILPGRYTVVAIEKGWDLDWRNPIVLKPYLEHGEVVEVAANKTYKISVKAQAHHATVADAPPGLP